MGLDGGDEEDVLEEVEPGAGPPGLVNIKEEASQAFQADSKSKGQGSGSRMAHVGTSCIGM